MRLCGEGKVSISNFHDELLKDGCLPLETLEKKMDAWAENRLVKIEVNVK